MSERFTFAQTAPGFTSYAPGCLDGQIGKPFPASLPGGQATGTLVSYEVADDGAAVTLTVEVPDGTLPQSSSPSGSSAVTA